jgi:FKBP-type peptidyl-prolyl cis-trans isomerase
MCTQDELVLETVAVTTDGGIKKLVLTRGNGDVPSKGEKVHAHYDGRLASDGKQFDSSYNRGSPFSFQLGGGQVIKGWDLGFATMSLGEKAILVIDPQYGYGAAGAGGVIPGGATLYFMVELMAISPKGGKGPDRVKPRDAMPDTTAKEGAADL